MRLAIQLSRLNAEHRTGGPFGAAVFDMSTGALLGVGVNRVVPLQDPTLHGEIVAMCIGLGRIGSFSYREAGVMAALYTSSEPCGMCCTAILWGGVQAVYYGATTGDIEGIGFKEGLKPRDWRRRCREEYGTAITGPICRVEARRVLRFYARMGQALYNG